MTAATTIAHTFTALSYHVHILSTHFSLSLSQVTYTQGAPPNLFMKDAEGRTIDEVNVGSWKAESIEEYLTEKLMS